MPTITTVDVSWETTSTLDAAELRRLDTAMFLGDGSNNGVRGGIVRHGGFSLSVSVNGSDQVTVQAGAAVIPAATGLGVYRAALSAATAATASDPRNATNPRIDLVVFRSTGAVDIITGTPGASPSAPALPANAVELARLNVPAVGGGAVTVDFSRRAYAAALGGTLWVESATRLPGSGNDIGQRAVAIDTGGEHIWTGSSWMLMGKWQNMSVINFPNLPFSSAQGRAAVHGDTVHVRAKATVSGAAGSPIGFDLPFVANAAMGFGALTYIEGNVVAVNAGVGQAVGVPALVSSSRVQFASVSDGATWGATAPHTWKSGDTLMVNLTYERG